MTKKAMLIAFQAHKEKKDKNGIPYIFHPIHLAEQMDSEDAVIVALLHDVVEDTDWTMGDLEKQGFAKDVTDALNLLTKVGDIEYLDYVRRIKLSLNPLAITVKIADLRHNSDLSRLDHVDEDATKRIAKYAKAIAILTE
jgi:(p)ppGpp synthase/HD superfamily hydrolase